MLYAGLERLGAGAVVAGLMLGAIAYFIIAKEYSRAIVYSLIAAVLAFVGLIHDPAGLIFQVVDGSFSVRRRSRSGSATCSRPWSSGSSPGARAMARWPSCGRR